MGVVTVLSVSIFYVAVHQVISDQQINAYMLQLPMELGMRRELPTAIQTHG